MKMIVLRCSIVAVIIFIPLTSVQHFIEPLSECLLADLCNHTWIGVCGWNNKTDDYKLFLDLCDFYEFNCDNGGDYRLVNYTDCFDPSLSTTTPCPSLDRLVTKVLGYYIVQADKDHKMYPKRKGLKMPLRNQRRYTPEKTRKIRRHTTQCTSCDRNKQIFNEIDHLEEEVKKIALLNATTKKRSTGQVQQSGKKVTVVLKRETVWKNGKIMHRVVKGYQPEPKNVEKKFKKPKEERRVSNEDSDFLEYQE